MNKKGFTLLETLLVISLTGILMATIIPTGMSLIHSSKEKKAFYELQSISLLISEIIDSFDSPKTYYFEGANYVVSIPFSAATQNSTTNLLNDDINYNLFFEIFIWGAILKMNEFTGGTYTYEKAIFDASRQNGTSKLIYNCSKGVLTFTNNVYNNSIGKYDYLKLISIEYLTDSNILVKTNM